ncbi:MAG: TolC family protein [Polyangia bacterium]
MEIGLRQNLELRILEARLRGAEVEVQRSLSALLPRLTAQGRMTLNHPLVTLELDERTQAFQTELQRALVAALRMDASFQTSSAGLSAYCRTAPPTPEAAADRGRVDELCQLLIASQQPKSQEELARQIGQSRYVANLTPIVQLDASLALTVPLVVPPAYPAIRSAREQQRAQASQLRAAAAQLAASIAQAYYAAAAADALLELRKSSVTVARKNAEDALRRVQLGLADALERARAELAVAQAEQRQAESGVLRAAAHRSLATLLALDTPFALAAESESPLPPPEDVGALVERALSGRSEVQQLEQLIRSSESLQLAQTLKWLPSLGLFGAVRLTNATGFAGRADSYAAGLQLDWNLFDGLERDVQRRALAAQAAEARARLAQLRRVIAAEVRGAVEQVELRRSSVLLAQRASEAAAAALVHLQRRYQAGTIAQIELLLGQEQAVAAQVDQTRARYDLAVEQMRLSWLTGALLP